MGIIEDTDEILWICYYLSSNGFEEGLVYDIQGDEWDRDRMGKAMNYLIEGGFLRETDLTEENGEYSGPGLNITNKGIHKIEEKPNKGDVTVTHKIKIGIYEFSRSEKK